MQGTATDRLSAVKFALASRRESTEVDILVATVQVLAHERPRGLPEMREAVLAAWPGTGLEDSRVQTAVEVAKSLGLIAERPGPAGDLLLHAVSEDPAVSSSIDWTNEVLARTRAGIRDRVSRELMRALSDAEIDWWMNALLDAVGAGIRQAFSVYQGDVSKPSHRWLIPSSYDRAAIRESIDELAPNEAVVRVLQALATEAIDPSVEFGSGVVTYLATGYILHAFLARRDVQPALETAGPLAGQRVILDTPLLYGLLETRDPSSELRVVLTAAVEQRLHLVLPQHCVDELKDAIRRARESGEADEIGRAVQSRQDAELYRGLTAGIISVWLTRRASGDTQESWDQFEEAAAALLEELRDAFGVNTIEFNRHGDPELRRLAAAHAEDLRGVLERRSIDGRPDRGAWQIGNDGQTLAMVQLARERSQQMEGTSPWPGGWVVSPDTAMGPAFDRVAPDSEHSAVITAAQLGHILATFAAPPSMADLAESAARLLSHDTFVHVAARFPPGTAIEMAEALRSSGEGHAGMDNRFAQLSLREILEEREREDIDYGTALLRLQARRRSELAAMQVAATTESLNRYSEEIVDLTNELESSEAERLALAEARAAIEIERTRSEAEKQRLEERIRDLEQERTAQAAEHNRELSLLTTDHERDRQELEAAQSEISGLQNKVDHLADSLEEDRRGRRRRGEITLWAVVVVATVLAATGIWWALNVGVAAAFAFFSLLWPTRRLSEAILPDKDHSFWPSVIGGAIASGLLLLVQLAISAGD